MKNILEIDLENPDIYQEKVWGNTNEIAQIIGQNDEFFGDKVIGEVFIASTHPDGLSRFVDGRLMSEVTKSDQSVFGTAISPKGDFPILLKALSATQQLSVQTHYKNKVEAWYTLSDGEMLYGLTQKGAEQIQTQEGRDKLATLLHDATDVETLAPYFNHVKFHAGESYIIHAGMVHALLAGTVLEPQKNSNLTMRGGDWGRNDPNRQLHTRDFFMSLYPNAIDPRPIEPRYKAQRKGVAADEGSEHACLFATNDFALDKITLDHASRKVETFEDRFFIVNMLKGEMTLTNGDGDHSETHELKKDKMIVMCAQPNEWTFSGTGEVLLTYVPNLIKGIIEPLKANGNSYEDIVEIGGPVIKDNDIYIELKEKGLL